MSGFLMKILYVVCKSDLRYLFSKQRSHRIAASLMHIFGMVDFQAMA